ncbi:MAG: DUF4878 domain-containing protein [Chitinophagaceae bacterium]|nr:DUF4878 domain-containing protein [Chitinophagaceae bacterium]
MKYLIIFAAVILFAGCGVGYEKAEDPQDAGRQFIRASLDGDYKKARFYMLEDSTNALLIERQKRNYEELNGPEKQQHRNASIRPISIEKVNDTATVYKYFNTYNTKDTTSITVVKYNGDWLVDLKSILRH